MATSELKTLCSSQVQPSCVCFVSGQRPVILSWLMGQSGYRQFGSQTSNSAVLNVKLG